MTNEEIIKKISNKEEKIAGMSQRPEKAQDLLRDIKVLYEEKHRVEMENLKAEYDKKIAELNSVPRVEPMHFCIPQSSVVDEFDMGACAAVKTTTGYEWRAKGGFRLYTENTNQSLSSAIESFFEMRDDKEVKTPEQQDEQEHIISALTYVLNYPMIAFSDSEFFLKMATHIVRWMNEKYDELIEKTSLKEDDDPELTRDFQNATIAMENIKEELDKSVDSKS